MARRRRSRVRGGGEQDFELNIASVIDCFTVLITYLLVSASFISLGVLDVSVASNGPAAEVAPEPEVNLSIVLAADKSMTVKLTGKETRSVPVAADAKGWNFQELTEVLKPIKERWPQLDTAMVAADSAIEYRVVVSAVETARKTMPVVYLGDPQ